MSKFYYCDVHPDVDQDTMQAWLAGIEHRGIYRETFDSPHPLTAGKPIVQVPAAMFRDLDQARTFRDRFGAGIYTTSAPYMVE